jgi:hypothetical protein
MRITGDKIDSQSLADLGIQAVQMLCSGNLSVLAKEFGYALAYGRDPVSAISEELASSLAELGASALGLPPSTPPVVSYFKSNSTGLFALVEQWIPTNGSGRVLLELIIIGQGAEKHATLEQISSMA